MRFATGEEDQQGDEDEYDTTHTITPSRDIRTRRCSRRGRLAADGTLVHLQAGRRDVLRERADAPAGGFEIAQSAEKVWGELTADDALHWCRILDDVRWTSPRPFGVGTTREVKSLRGADVLREHLLPLGGGPPPLLLRDRSDRAARPRPRRGLPGRAARRRCLPLHLDDRGRARPPSVAPGRRSTGRS